MVNRLITITLLVLAALVASPAMANGLEVTPDRTRIYEGETVTLTVEGSMKIEINLDNLFDIGNANLPSPDIEKLEPDFEIVGQNQRYSIRTVNNEMRGEITWTYQLLPRKTGTLTIPALTFKGDQSDPVTIEVVEGSPPGEQNSSRDAFIELSTDKDELYVQEQLLFTVKLFFRGNLIRGDLSTPEHPDALIEPLGKQREYTTSVGDKRYRVVERRYAIYPQSPGTLDLGAIHFEGQARDSSGQLRFLRDSKRLFDIPVKPVPTSWTGDTWLPASKVTLSSRGLESVTSAESGQSLTRTLTMTAEGLPPSALPSLPETMPDGIRLYPEPEQRDSAIGTDGLVSTLTRVNALVPVQTGQITLPEITVDWWDTRSNTQRTARIPAKTLMVEKAVSGQASTPVPPTRDPGNTDDASPGGQSEARGKTPWAWISLLLALGWLATTAGLLWWTRRKRAPGGTANTTGESDSDSALFRQLCTAADRGQPSALQLLPRWVASRYQRSDIHSALEAAEATGDPELVEQVRRLQTYLYSGQTFSWDGRPIVGALKRVKASKHQSDPRADRHLPPLYPEGFNGAR